MAIRAAFLLTASGFLLVLAPGACAPAAADPHSYQSAEIDQAVVPSSSEDDGAPPLENAVDLLSDALGQPWDFEVGSGGGFPDPGRLESGQEATAEVVRVDADPWAEALAEAARLVNTSRAPELPSFPVVINAQVQRFLDRFTGSRRDLIGLWLSRSTRYLGMIRENLRAQGLPEDLAFVAMIESGFNPLAVSRAGAKGLWQFMAGTARRYGLRVDQWVDERLDPEKSTTAAVAYLRDLHQQFGSWALAKAAYNAGEVKVTRAVRAVGTNDFWAIARSRFLRQETKEFVPAIHAATVIGRDPGRYGFEPSEAETAATEIVRVPAGTSLRTLAAAAGLAPNGLKALNPVLVKGITPPGPAYSLKVPAGTGDRVLAAFDRVKPSERGPRDSVIAGSTGSPDVHVVRSGETLIEIAKQHGVSVSDVIRWNSLGDPRRIRPGDRLQVAGIRVSATQRPAPTGGQ